MPKDVRQNGDVPDSQKDTDQCRDGTLGSVLGVFHPGDKRPGDEVDYCSDAKDGRRSLRPTGSTAAEQERGVYKESHEKEMEAGYEQGIR